MTSQMENWNQKKSRFRHFFTGVCTRSILASGVILVLVICLGSSGCGMKGPLEHPPDNPTSFRAVLAD